MSSNSNNHIINKVESQDISSTKVQKFMSRKFVPIMEHFTIASTIETFKLHNISGSPIINQQDKIIGMISEYDLLLQAAANDIESKIQYNKSVISLSENSTLKDALILFYSKKLKLAPVVNKFDQVIGIVYRIDILDFIVKNK